MSPQGKYIYGIIEEVQPRIFNFLGLGDAPVYTINHQSIAAVVSDTELQEIDPTRKNVHAHTIVQDELLKDYTVLPIGFGMIATSKDKVRTLLEKNHQGLGSELNRLAGKIQIELKVFWDQEALIRELQGDSGELTRLKAQLGAASSPAEAQNLLVKAGRLVERAALEWKTKYADLVYAVLKEFSHDAQVNNPAGIKSLLNASFLIDRSKERQFKEEVYRLDSTFEGKVNFKYVGPLPPYNFVTMKLEPAK